jgi:radical SAM superfamily enzyme
METVAKLERFRSYNKWLKDKFGERVYKVIVDAGFTCPNRDGAVAVGGCAYCNNSSFRPPSAIKTDPIRDQVREGVEYIRRRFEANKFIVYFQPFTNTYAETAYLRRLYADAIDTFVSLEFGVESIYDDTLRRVNRGHDYAAFLRAMELTRGRGIHIGAHLILGFPWETREQWLAMADEMSRVRVDALKIHHLHLVRGTALAAEYTRRPFPVLGYEEYLDLLCDFVERLDPNIVIERMFGEAPLDLLVAPNWRRTKNDLVLDIQRKFEERNVWQGKKRGVSSIHPHDERL